MNHLVSIIKSDGTRQLFEEEKLVNSLKRVGASGEVIDEVVDQIGSEIRDGMTTSEIYRRAFDLLKRSSAKVAAKYSVRRAMIELGPEGFPFEKYVARIFNLKGYETLTDQVVPGKCVEHEIDVIAWKDDNLAMIEAKYHNEFGLKSDLKVSLYVKARYDDIAGNVFDFGGRKRTLNEKWLVTNTKFTDKAIKYGQCVGMKLLGWNYPPNESLHDLISSGGLQPITCLTSLSRDQKKELISKGVIMCLDIVGNPRYLYDAGIKPEEHENILTEAQIVIENAK